MGYVREIQYVMRLKNKDHHQQKKYLDAQIKKKKCSIHCNESKNSCHNNIIFNHCFDTTTC